MLSKSKLKAQKIYREKHHKELLIKGRKYYDSHRKQYHDWYIKNKEGRIEYCHNYYRKNIKRIKKYYADRYAKHKTRILLAAKGYRLKREFGITLEQYYDLFGKQNNKCAICGKEYKTGDTLFHVDHNHSTGKIRGIVCFPCNAILGLIHDSLERIEAVKQYLINTSLPEKKEVQCQSSERQ